MQAGQYGATPLAFARFAIEAVIHRDGHSAVAKARDTETGRLVALKMMYQCDPAAADRFIAGATQASELKSPYIAAPIVFGVEQDIPYAATEWVEGETLLQRSLRGPLSMPETLDVAIAVGQALVHAHGRGVVHGNLKPSNVLLPSLGSVAAMVLDFGLAQQMESEFTPSRVLGLPAFMAPEQVHGGAPIDSRADIYALACLLHKCATGRVPFESDDLMTMLLKVVLEQPPNLSAICPAAPKQLDALVRRMLQKERAQRPADARGIVSLLEQLRGGDRLSEPPPSRHSSLTRIEKRSLTLVLARTDLGETRALRERRLEALGVKIRNLGEKLDMLADGSIIVMISPLGAATDRAARAARCALAIRRVFSEAKIAIASGRGVISSDVPDGEVIERGVRMLAQANDVEHVRLDDLSTGLLEPRFEVQKQKQDDGDGYVLLGERDRIESGRTLLGKPTPCVGREKELAWLGEALARSVRQPGAAAVLVTGPAGIGKSRLAHEFSRRALATFPNVEIWMSRADPMRAGAPFSLIGQAIRQAADIQDGESLDVRRAKLKMRIARAVDAADVDRITDFLCELIGASATGTNSVPLLTARQDAVLMGDQMRRAWQDFLRAECASQPVVLILDDLHWGDVPTVQFIDAALRTLTKAPLFILGLARLEVHDVFPMIWAGRSVTELALGALPLEGSEHLAREVLGDTSDPRVRTLIERAGGNVFYLEELLRAFAESKFDAFPETVLAMAQARLERLDPDARRVLRAASVFGEAFSIAGVEVLLGDESRERLTEHVHLLVEKEVIAPRGDALWTGDRVYAFRHALVRDAAYAMLDEPDRELGHRLAAEWLEQTGERDAIVVAEHFERGGDRPRALNWYVRAAEQAHEGNDLDAVLSRGERAVRCGATGSTLGAIRLLQAETLRWRSQPKIALHHAREAVQALPFGTAKWHMAIAEVALNGIAAGRHDDLENACTLILRAQPSNDVAASRLIALGKIASALLQGNLVRRTEAIFACIARERSAAPDSPAVLSSLHHAEAMRGLYSQDVARYLSESVARAQAHDAAGDVRGACLARATVGYAHALLGCYEEAAEVLQEALSVAERFGLSMPAAYAQHNLGIVLAYLGKMREARDVEQKALKTFEESTHVRLVGACSAYAGQILLMMGDLQSAENHASRAIEKLSMAPQLRAYACAILGRIYLAQGRPKDALEVSRRAMDAGDGLGGAEEEINARLVHAQSLHACGHLKEAREAISVARVRLLAQAERIHDRRLQKRFLERVPHNAAVLSLARTWGVAGE